MKSFSQMMTHETSDGGLATSTHRPAIKTPISPPRISHFGPNAEPIPLPKLDAHLATLKTPAFTPWTEILTTSELQEYQSANHRKFPLLHMIPPGLSLSDLKSNTRKREVLPGFENDCWRFLIDVGVLTAGSPYVAYLTLNIFRVYTRAVVSLFSGMDEDVVDRALSITGGGAMGLTIVFLVILVLLYKCYRGERTDSGNPQFDKVHRMFSGAYLTEL
jgi:hypothetical protein